MYINYNKSILNFDFSKLQVIYIDGSHQPQDVLTDAVMAWKLLKKEGIMILDGMQQVMSQPTQWQMQLVTEQLVLCRL